MPLPQRSVIGGGGGAKGQFIGFREARIDSSNATTYTFSSINFGAPHAKRCIILGLTCDGSAPAVSTITIGGITATAVIQTIDGNERAGIWIARVPGQITGSVVVTLTQAETNCSIAVFSAVLNSTTASGTDSDVGATNLTVTIPAYGFAVFAMIDGGAPGAMSDSGGMTEVYDQATEGAEVWYGFRTTAGSYTSNIAGDTGTNAKVVAAWSLA